MQAKQYLEAYNTLSSNKTVAWVLTCSYTYNNLAFVIYQHTSRRNSKSQIPH